MSTPLHKRKYNGEPGLKILTPEDLKLVAADNKAVGLWHPTIGWSTVHPAQFVMNMNFSVVMSWIKSGTLYVYKKVK